ncbi:MAG: VCBS repeat-containing protein [Planctomycetes bacterium]|nr:VCBS repeat-containing protein [Planctomycetota bacterium]
MKPRSRFLIVLALLAFALLIPPGAEQSIAPGARAEEASVPEFRMQEIENGLGVGYGVLLVDVNGDGKKDIVVVDTTRVVWYENPSWKRRIITEGKTKPDNVCIAAYDIDGDGKIDFALGSGWKGLNSKTDGPIYWLKRGKSLDEPWKVIPIADEPSVHRIRFANLPYGKPALIVVPLLGRNSTAAKNWMDGAPVRILALKIPKDPAHDRWTPEVLDESLHVVHNFHPVPNNFGGNFSDILTASYEGVHRLNGQTGRWTKTRRGTGNQDNPRGNRGASEIKEGVLGKRYFFIATIEPWHGNQVVVYTMPDDPAKLWDRHVVDKDLKWGHAVWCADLDGDGSDELIVGVRDDLSAKPGERRGVRIYKATDNKGTKWQRTLVDEGGVAVEDLAAADLDGDGRVDIVAVGRQTHNVRIYWNKQRR